MIKRLWIQNYAIISEVELLLSDGLTIITGETGAGKSILTGALGLIMGNRADTKVLFDPEKKCVVEAVFDVSEYKLKAFFDNNDLDYNDEVVVRREINGAGKSRAFVNDTPATLTVLKQLSEHLIDLHQQFDTGELEDASFQIKVLDALAGNGEILTNYRSKYESYQRAVRKQNSLKSEAALSAKEKDFLLFQFNELSDANIKANELEEIQAKFEELSHKDEIKRALALAKNAVYDGELNASSSLREALFALRDVADFKAELREMYERIDSLYMEVSDAGNEIENLYSSLDDEEESLDQIQQRLNELNRLTHKHQVETTDELLGKMNDFKTQLSKMDSFDEEIEILEKEIKSLKKNLIDEAKLLSSNRKKVTADFESKVISLLSKLSMGNAVFSVELKSQDQPGSTGMDTVDFMVATNKGSKLLPIGAIASGGELSRIALSVKSLVADSLEMPTIIFDEIDTGISGDVALKMGEILRDLAQKHQVVCITHSPQIAARAMKHYFVHKEDQVDRTITKIKELDKEGRIYAIATMLSSNPPTASAIENAKELITF